MTVYNAFESMYKKQQIANNEKIIKEIDDFYYNYRYNGAVNFIIGTRVEYCLNNGLDGFNYYIKDYINSDFISEEFSLLVQRTQEMVSKTNNLETQKQKYLEQHKKYFEVILKSLGETPKNDVNENFKSVLKKYKEEPQAFGYFQQAVLFGVGFKNIPEFKEIYQSIEKDIFVKSKDGKNITIATKEVFKEKNINLNLNKLFETLEMKEKTLELEQEKENI